MSNLSLMLARARGLPDLFRAQRIEGAERWNQTQ
jgi:hypothetical protein